MAILCTCLLLDPSLQAWCGDPGIHGLLVVDLRSAGTEIMARFDRIGIYHINAELVRFVEEYSSEADGPKDSCSIYFSGSDEPLNLKGHQAASVIRMLSNQSWQSGDSSGL
jgi:hypothetical protein